MLTQTELNSIRTAHMLFTPPSTKSVGLEIGRDDNEYRGGLPVSLVWKHGTERLKDMTPEIKFEFPVKSYEPMSILSLSQFHCKGETNMDGVLKYLSLRPPSASLSSVVKMLKMDIDGALVDCEQLPDIEATNLEPVHNRWELESIDTNTWWYLSISEFLSGDWIWLNYRQMSSTSRVTLYKCTKDTAFDDMCGVLEQGVKLCKDEGIAGMRNIGSSLGVLYPSEDPYSHLDSVKRCGSITKEPRLYELAVVNKIGVEGALEEYETQSEARVAAGDPFMSLLQEAEAAGRPVRRSWRQIS